MKKICIFLSMLCFISISAQAIKTVIPDHWKRIDSLILANLPRSASDELEKLLVKLPSRDPERIKAYILLGHLKTKFMERGIDSLLVRIKNEREQVGTPMRNLYDLAQTNLYIAYAEEHQVAIRDREDSDVPQLPMQEWGYKRFRDTVTALYNRILTPELKKYKSSDYVSISTSGNLNGTPTLYELVSNSILDQMLVSFSNNSIADTIFKTIQETNNPDSEASALFQYRTLEYYDRYDTYHARWIPVLREILTQIQDKPLYPDMQYNLAYMYYACDKFREADSLAQEIIRRFPNNKNSQMAQTLIDHLHMPQIDIENNQQSPYPGKEWLLKVTTQKTKEVSLGIYPVSLTQYLNSSDSTYQQVKCQIPLKSWSQILPEKEFYRSYSYRYEMPALPQGCYLLNIEAYHKADTVRSYFFFQVSPLSYYCSRELVSVNDKKNGERLKNTAITRYKENSLVEHARTDCGEDGMFQRKLFSKNEKNICLSAGDKKLWTSFYSSYYYDSFQLEIERMYPLAGIIFTDRHLYRPGQRIQFKGIGYRYSNDKQFVPNRRFPNSISINIPGQPLITQTYESNEYGSFYGYYDIPNDIPSGTLISIGFELNRVEVRVEEYKLPKTEIQINIRDKYYSPKDSVEFRGNVKSLTGVNVGGSTVSCTINRNSYSCFTDKDGRFSLKIPHDTYFRFKIVATTPAGETCTLERSFDITRQPLHLEFSLPEIIPTNKPLPIDLKFKTATHVSINHGLQLKIESLRKKSIWFNTQDSALISRKRFKQIAPNHAYTPQDKIFIPIQTVMDTSFHSQAAMTERLKQLALQEGYYRITVSTTDSLDQKLSETRQCKIINPKSKKALQEHFYYYAENKTYFPGDTLKLILGSACKDMHLLIVKTNNSEEKYFDILLNEEQKVLSIPIEKEDQGNYLLNIMGAGDFQTVAAQINVTVAWLTKQLNVELASFRDKVVSGDKETVQIKVTDIKGKNVPCEILAYMYDHALDKLYEGENRLYGMPYPSSHFIFYNTIFSSQLGYTKKDFSVKRYPFTPSVQETPAIFHNFNIIPRKKDILEFRRRFLTAGCAQVPFVSTGDDNLINMKKAPDIPVNQNVKIRQNLQETAFFYPFIRTDKNGVATFEYTAPESLSRWRLNIVAHSKQMGLGSNSCFITVYKKVMANLNVPRFLIEGDSIQLVARIDNLTDETLPLESRFELFTLNPVTGKYDTLQTAAPESTQLNPNASVNVTTSFRVPEGCTDVTCRILAIANSHTDAEERKIPVIGKQVFITESVPFTLLSGESKTLRIDKLKQADVNKSRKPYSLTLDLSPNPTNMIIETLPVLDDESSEYNTVLFNRFYGNRIAASIHARFGSTWIAKLKAAQEKDTTTLTSPLTKKNSLKHFQSRYTPWLADAQDQTEQRQHLLNYFTPNNIEQSCQNILDELFNRQQNDGSFTWVKGIPVSDQYVTLYIASGFGRLLSQGLLNYEELPYSHKIKKILAYLDDHTTKKHNMSSKSLTRYECYYLYARTMYPDSLLGVSSPKIKKDLLKKVVQNWQNFPTYLRAMLASALWREKDQVTAREIIKSLLENAVVTRESGMYWKFPTISFDWYMRPIETQSLMIELLTLVGQEEFRQELQQMRQWLMLQKRTNSWGYSTATTDAIYAFLLDTKVANDSTTVLSARIGNQTITAQEDFSNHRTTWNASKLSSSMSEVSVNRTVSSTPVSFGAVYYQYFDERDSVKGFQTDLSVKRELYRTSPPGKLIKILPDEEIHQGENITVRITLKCTQDMEYIQMRDLRGAAFEPESQLSRYEYQDGLIYFKTVKDASVDFYINQMRKGTYIIDYKIVATQVGEFSCGYTEIQSMFAPEFGSRTNGIAIKILPSSPM